MMSRSISIAFLRLLDASPPRFLSAPFPLLAAVLFLFLISACANPVPPPGGPRDTTPPSIDESSPEAREVNVDTDTRSVEITFSEYVDQGSLQEALSVTPEFEQPLEFSWSGRRVEIRFPESLRENTTYILTFDTELADERGVNLEEPITLAFSTGPVINEGRLAGRVVSAERGEEVGGIDVYAYAVPDSSAPDPLPERPAYRTQTDTEGHFEFEYLNEQPYFVIALRDRNRNRQPDPEETYAVPPRPALAADTAAVEDTLRWVTGAHDTIPPEVVRVQPRSQSRFALRFDEPVRLTTPAPDDWTLRDSLADAPRAVEAVYQRTGNWEEVLVRTEALRAEPHLLRPPSGAVADTSGNEFQSTNLSFTPPETSDTLQTRFQGFVPEGLVADSAGARFLLPGLLPGVRFNQPVDSTQLHQLVTMEGPEGSPRAFAAQTSDGTTYRLQPSTPLRPAETVRVTVDGQPFGRPDTVFARTFRRVSNDQLGELSGTVAADTTGPFVVELYAADRAAALPEENGFGTLPLRSTRAGENGDFLFAELPEGTYRFRAFLDRDGDGQWDPGQIVPYRPAEPITWSTRELRVRPRWETALEDPLRIPNFGS